VFLVPATGPDLGQAFLNPLLEALVGPPA
jgi:hypothetical protein